jgi:hypothetical protein
MILSITAVSIMTFSNAKLSMITLSKTSFSMITLRDRESERDR